MATRERFFRRTRCLHEHLRVARWGELIIQEIRGTTRNQNAFGVILVRSSADAAESALHVVSVRRIRRGG